MEMMLDRLERAARLIVDADALFIGAGAGMGVDSGLPDYRGSLGYWTTNPDWEELASGGWFVEDPRGAWEVMREKLGAFARATPHAGYDALLSMSSWMSHGAFAYTSNVDGHFARAGFHRDRVLEVHGTMWSMQCATMCTREVWPVEDLDAALAPERLPRCERCGGVARPNVLLFGDNLWTCSRHVEQNGRFLSWRDGIPGGAKVVVLEVGAGDVIPSIREQCEAITSRFGGTLVRINPFDAECEGGIGIALGACAALTQLERLGKRLLERA